MKGSSESADVIIQERSKIQCPDKSGTISDLDEREENILCCLDSSCDAYEQMAKITGKEKHLSASIAMPSGNASKELHGLLKQHNASEVESKSPAVSHIGSEAANCLGGFPHASSGDTETVACEE